MKKRKFPVGLVVALVVLLGGAGAYSVYNTTVANRSPEETVRLMQEEQMREAMKNQPPPSANAPGSSPSKEALRGQVAATARGSQEGGDGPGRPGRPGDEAAPAGTSILAPKPAPYKPVPNDSATSSQWFTPKDKK